MRTVREITFDLFRKLGLTTVVGNPGSTEEPFLADFPSDFDYVLALQETSAVAVADGLSQSLRRPVLVNLHTGAGTGNAMGAIVTAYLNKTPLIITAGQQTREMLLIEPLLTNIDATLMARPWVKWSYEPARAEDVPAAFMRAHATAIQPPAGPVYLSLPLDDWEKRMAEVDIFRTVAARQGPDPSRIREFAQRIDGSRNPVLVYGSDIARSEAWNAGIAFAEKLGAPVWTAPFAPRSRRPIRNSKARSRRPSARCLSNSPDTTSWWSSARRCSATTRSCPAPIFRPARRFFISPTTRRSRPRRRSATAWLATRLWRSQSLRTASSSGPLPARCARRPPRPTERRGLCFRTRSWRRFARTRPTTSC